MAAEKETANMIGGNSTLNNGEIERLRRDIYRPDMDKLRLFTQMLRVNALFKKAKVTHKYMASIADLEGIKVPFLHINHLIENKKIVNRIKDQIDVIELEKIRKIREADE